jgi:peptidoglycan/LPS O-acetylase OafA/YrhL
MKAVSKLGALTQLRSPEPGTGYLPTLDGWRALAILGVMICHASDAFFHADGPYPNARWHALAAHGALGVDIFFGISGFLICSRLLAEHQRHGGISLRRFYTRRFFRILPPYLTYLGGLAVLAAFGLVGVSPGVWWSCLLFYRNYLPGTQGGGFYTGHFWSLSVEEHFYLTWPTLLVLLGIGRARRAVVGLAGAIALWREWEFRHQWLAQWVPGMGFIGRTDIRLDGLLWGCWMALVLNDPIWRERLSRWLSSGVWLALVFAYVGCVYYQPALAALWQALLIPILLAGTVLRPLAPAGRFLEWLPLRWIGRISYSLYLWNWLFFPGMDHPWPLPLGAFQQLPWSIFSVFVCASLSYYLIERPMIRLGHSLTRRTTPQIQTKVGAKAA